MKLTTGILVITMMAGSAGAQSPNIIQDTRDKLNAVQQQKAADSAAALDASSGQAKPTPSKPAATTGKPAASKPGVTPKPASVSVSNTRAAKPNTSPVTAKPVAVTVERMPVTTPKTNPGTVQKASAMPGPKAPVATPTKPTAPTVQKAGSMPVQKTTVPAASKATAVPASTSGQGGAVAKPAPKATERAGTVKPVVVVVPQSARSAKKTAAKPVVPAGEKPPQEKERKFAMTGTRDPFVSPVVSHAGSAGCNTGKKCLEIGQINLKGVVRSDAGMIAVVTNSMNKAYFLRENDPVFNGYVEKITADSITFKETVQDKLGKPFTRAVVKKILTPAV
jgi:Tfp pilus assembly protein PilP